MFIEVAKKHANAHYVADVMVVSFSALKNGALKHLCVTFYAVPDYPKKITSSIYQGGH